MSRRGAVKVNPVTGKLERVDVKSAAAEGMHQDGSLRISDRYINAAKELGLGGNEGMYQHIKGLVRAGAADVPVGTSIETEGVTRGVPGSGADGKARAPIVDVKNTAAAQASLRTHLATVGRAKVAGFAGATSSSKPTIHGHVDSFQRRKGVINTMGGAKDISRASTAEEPRLPPKSERRGAQVVTMDTFETTGAEGRARREAAEKRMAARSHSAAPASRHPAPASGPTARAAAGAGAASSSSGSSSSAVRRAPATTNVLGGKSAPGTAETAGSADLASRRAAYFDKKFAEDAAKKAAPRGAGTSFPS